MGAFSAADVRDSRGAEYYLRIEEAFLNVITLRDISPGQRRATLESLARLGYDSESCVCRLGSTAGAFLSQFSRYSSNARRVADDWDWLSWVDSLGIARTDPVRLSPFVATALNPCLHK